MNRHINNNHEINVVLHKCPHCIFQTKYESSLKQHLANRHDIGMSWHKYPHSDYKSKRNSTLKRPSIEHIKECSNKLMSRKYF